MHTGVIPEEVYSGCKYAAASDQGLPHAYAEMPVSMPKPLLPFHGTPETRKSGLGESGWASTLISLLRS